jgi:hypothetical protein
MKIVVDGRTVSFWAAEVYERVDRSFDISRSGRRQKSQRILRGPLTRARPYPM